MEHEERIRVEGDEPGGGARAGFRSGQGRRGARPWWRAEGASVRALQTEVAHVHADVLPENTSGYGRGRA
jgi:hypothetical protein